MLTDGVIRYIGYPSPVRMSSTASTSAQTSECRFSADVFFSILMFSGTKKHEMQELWISREVSRAYKDAVERVFIARHLRKTEFEMTRGGLW